MVKDHLALAKLFAQLCRVGTAGPMKMSTLL